MKFELIDLVIIIVMFQLVIFSLFLFTRKKGHYSNYILGLQLFSQAAGIFSGFCFTHFEYVLNSSPAFFFTGYPFYFLWGPTFYLYVKSASYSNFRIKGKYLLHFLPFVTVLLYLAFNFYILDNKAKIGVLTEQTLPIFTYSIYSDIFIRLQVLVYIILSVKILFKLKESYSSISKTNLSWIWFLVSGFTVSYFLSIPFLVYLYFNDYSSFISLLIFTPYFIYFNIIFFKAWYSPEIFTGVEEIVKYKSSRLSRKEAQEWVEELNEFMSANKSYLNPGLTIKELAEEINISPRILSQIINEYFNQNFYDYVNRLRVEESKIMLGDINNKKTVLEILYEVGFNSKTAFNIAFKKHTGFTPTEYRKKRENIFVP